MESVKTLATLVLGGAFDANELGDNDIVLHQDLIDDLQQRLVTGFDDVHIELVDRADLDRVTAENKDLQQRLTVQDQRVDELEELLQRVLDSSALSFEMDAPEVLETLEADICAALKPTAEAVSHE